MGSDWVVFLSSSHGRNTLTHCDVGLQYTYRQQLIGCVRNRPFSENTTMVRLGRVQQPSGEA